MDKLEQLKEWIEKYSIKYGMFGCAIIDKESLLSEISRLQSEPVPGEFCTWKRRTDAYGQPYYERSCTEEWATRKENCCGSCGKKIAIHKEN